MIDTEQLSKKYILDEVRKLQYLYGLKREIRYGRTRPEEDLTESVAEHLYGMHLLAHYFIPLEDTSMLWNQGRIFTMITIHDIDEIETGDTIGYLKTPEMYAAERISQEKVLENSPDHLKDYFSNHLDEYEKQETLEARFVKAIDRIEPLFQIYSPFGRAILRINKTRLQDSVKIKENYIKPFPVMYAFYQTIHETMSEEGYFYSED